MCGQNCGSICLPHRSAKKSKSRPSRNQNSINVFRLRGIYFLDPDDEEFKDLMKNARRKLEIPMPAAMPCKTSLCRNSRETCRTIGEHKTKFDCIAEADQSMRIRMEGVPRRYHEDHNAGKGMNSLSHYNLVHKFIRTPQAICKSSSGKTMGKIEENTGMAADKSEKQK